MVKPAIESEASRWDWMPFSFSPSDALLGLLKRRQNAYAEGRKQPPERRSVMCQNCGSVLVIGKGREAGIKIFERYCDKECAQQDRSRIYKRDKTGNKTTFTKAVIKQSKTSIEIKHCGICGRKKAIKKGSFFRCGKKCTEISKQNKLTLDRIEYRKAVSSVCTCKRCGCQFTHLKKFEKFWCSRKCLSRHVRRRKEHIARTSQKVGDDIIPIEVFQAAKWKCKQCKQKVVLSTGKSNPNEATIDHLMPLSKGGKHIWGNVQCLCRRCNTIKNDSVKEGIQLCLF
jgi:5-methylcytosine-specific restriction endonuclease McrA